MKRRPSKHPLASFFPSPRGSPQTHDSMLLTSTRRAAPRLARALAPLGRGARGGALLAEPAFLCRIGQRGVSASASLARDFSDRGGGYFSPPARGPVSGDAGGALSTAHFGVR